MDIAHPTCRKVESLGFHVYTADEIRKISVKALNQPILFNELGHPNKGGLYDPALGPLEKHGRCVTCHLPQNACPGHLGHIELAVPLYNPLLFTDLLRLLKMVCLHCHSFKMAKSKIAYYNAKLTLIKAGLYMDAVKLDECLDSQAIFAETEKSDSTAVSNARQRKAMEAADQIERLQAYVRTCLDKGQAEESSDMSHKTFLLARLRRQVMDEVFAKTPSFTCSNCRSYNRRIRKEGASKLFFAALPKKVQNQSSEMDILAHGAVADDDDDEAMEDNTLLGGEEGDEDDQLIPDTLKSQFQFITPLHIYEHLRLFFAKEQDTLSLFYHQAGYDKTITADLFFLHVVPVAPTRFRPASIMGDKSFEHPQNHALCEIIKGNQSIMDLRSEQSMDSVMKKTATAEDVSLPEEKTKSKGSRFSILLKYWIQLQEDVNALFDSQHGKSVKGKEPPPGIKQILEKKEGLFRKHMMGKRVNFAARSVISPDPNIETSEIGIPMVFAKKLTYPEPVTPYNIQVLRDAVINGPDEYPGATAIQNEDGVMTNLAFFSREKRIALANQLLAPSKASGRVERSMDLPTSARNKKVLRHLRSGDVVLLNRQPTLHKPSMMAHIARVLPGEKTIRMHYANCNTYNADFDGDEMNIHFPQTETGRAEAYFIASNDRQYLVPTTGDPLRGLIQDHVVAGVLMTCKDTFLQREEYIQLLEASLLMAMGPTTRIALERPAVLRPVPLWTGKQVITTLLKNLTRGLPPMTFTAKTRVPASRWDGAADEEARVHVMASVLVTGVLDKSQFGATKFGLVHSCYEIYGPSMAGKLLTCLGRLFTRYVQHHGFSCRMDDLLLTPAGDADRRALLQASYTEGYKVACEFVETKETVSKRVLDQELEHVLRNDDKLAGLDGVMKVAMNKCTSNVINACLPSGQLRAFPHNNMALMTVSGAKGSNVNFSQISCLLGQQELEGRRVPNMPSGKTLPSFQAFDTSARAGGYIAQRFLTGIRPQEYFFHCMAGREGLVDTAVKTSRSGYLQRCLIKHLEGLQVHYDHTVRDVDGSVVQFHYGEDSLDVTKQKHLTQFAFSAANYEALVEKYQPEQALSRMDVKSATLLAKKALKKPMKYDPVLSVYPPGSKFGSVSESYAKALNKYCSENPDKYLRAEGSPGALSVAQQIDPQVFRALMLVKYVYSLVDPGEAVGVLAAQSVGEPSTQMTLNTFHFAGFGAANVTLGIPRLREIVMTASKTIKTPMMSLRVKADATNEDVTKICNRLSKLNFHTLLEDISVSEKLKGKSLQSGNHRRRSYTVRFQFARDMEEMYGLTDDRIEEVIEKRFCRLLHNNIQKYLKRRVKNDSNLSESTVVDGDDDLVIMDSTTKSGRAPDSDIEMDDEEGEGDVSSARTKMRRKQQSSYDDEDDENDQEEQEETRHDEESDSEIEVATSSAVTLSSAKTLAKTSVSNSTMDRKARVTTSFTEFHDYRYYPSTKTCELELLFPANTPKILMLHLVEMSVKSTVVRQVKGINKCFKVKNEDPTDDTRLLACEGVNFAGIWEFQDIVDPNSLSTNHIHAILSTYGVEAARQALIQEIGSVFGVYGIAVDRRHLSLIADYMTFEGGYKPFNRYGIDSNPSPFLQMSYETTMTFLKNACMSHDVETLASPSAKIVMGQMVTSGTGCCDVLMPLQYKK